MLIRLALEGPRAFAAVASVWRWLADLCHFPCVRTVVAWVMECEAQLTVVMRQGIWDRDAVLAAELVRDFTGTMRAVIFPPASYHTNRYVPRMLRQVRDIGELGLETYMLVDVATDRARDDVYGGVALIITDGEGYGPGKSERIVCYGQRKTEVHGIKSLGDGYAKSTRWVFKRDASGTIIKTEKPWRPIPVAPRVFNKTLAETFARYKELLDRGAEEA